MWFSLERNIIVSAFALGCPCGNRIEVRAGEDKAELRCVKCNRYVKVPKLKALPADLTTETLMAAAKDTNIGKVLAKRFRLESFIADGAAGSVYRATDILVDRTVAIKMLKSFSGGPAEAKERSEKRFFSRSKDWLGIKSSWYCSGTKFTSNS